MGKIKQKSNTIVWQDVNRFLHKADMMKSPGFEASIKKSATQAQKIKVQQDTTEDEKSATTHRIEQSSDDD